MRQNKSTHSPVNCKGKGGMESKTVQRRSCAPHLQAPLASCPIAAPRLTAKHHRDATEAERLRRTGPPLCCKPGGTSSRLSVPSFLPSYHVLPSCSLSAASRSLLCGTAVFKNSTSFPVVSGHSCVSRGCLSCVIRSHQCSKPGIRASTSSGHLTGLFLFLFFLKWTSMCML